ncbi:MAG: hypothetical protein IPN86_13925 [Saprospiraceae bacterium]|nr:hypothetical protein [Saprospiraceae bacterium]
MMYSAALISKKTESNLRAILDKVKVSNPDVKLVLAGMEAPPNMGQRIYQTIRNYLPKTSQRI